MIAAGARTGAMFVALLCCLSGLAGLSGCASTGGPDGLERDPDPWQKMNRGIFRFNDWMDVWALEPASKAWGFVMPDPVQLGIKNVADNIWMPAVFANHLLQAHPKDAFLADLPRLVVNTAIGWGGLFDVASPIGIEHHYSDFGITMGRWGLPPGPYLELPLFGPSSVRDGAGRIADGYSVPYVHFVPFWSSLIIRGVELVNLRELYAEELAQSKAEAFDYYLFRRDAWIQNRSYLVREARGESTADALLEDDFYLLEDESEEESPE